MSPLFGRRGRPGKASTSATGTPGDEGSPAAEPAGAAPGGPPAEPWDVLLADTLARHFEGATLEGSTVHGAAGLDVACRVDGVQTMGDQVAATLFLTLRGGVVGPVPVFASISGYGRTPEEAVVTGCCGWACAFGPVLRVAAGGPPDPEVDEVRIDLDGSPYRVVVGHFDRSFGAGSGPEPAWVEARTRLGRHTSLTTAVLESQTLPALAGAASTVLSVFVAETSPRTTEIKVNGADWAPARGVFDAAPLPPPGGVALLRELAVATRLEPRRLPSRPVLEQTMRGLAVRDLAGSTAGWQGWWSHGGVLGEPVGASRWSEVEAATGPLPDDVRRFFTEIAGPGAGPGYGLLRPERRGDVMPLAHAGCGVTWVLRLEAGHLGEVWVDAGGSDGGYRRVAASFTDWLCGWLDAAVRDVAPFAQWDNARCAPADVLSQVVEAAGDAVTRVDGRVSLADRVGAGAISLRSGGGYLPEGQPSDPCQACVAMADRLGLAPDVFAPGALSGGRR